MLQLNILEIMQGIIQVIKQLMYQPQWNTEYQVMHPVV